MIDQLYSAQKGATGNHDRREESSAKTDASDFYKRGTLGDPELYIGNSKRLSGIH